MTPDERDLDALLRQPGERLSPPDGSWEQISRRANRRKWAKASLATAAAVVVVAGAVPAVIAVRHNNSGGGDQTVQILASKTMSPPSTHGSSPRPAPALPTTPALIHSTVPGFFPDSLSFISQTHAFAWGSIGGSKLGAIATTIDGGATWRELPAPMVDNGFDVSNGGGAQIRFASGKLGFVYGSQLWETQDRGNTWFQVRAPGYVDDLEAMHGRIWALVQRGNLVRLYSATTADPTLQLVHAIGAQRAVQGGAAIPGTASIAVDGNSVDVLIGSSGFWSTPDGTNWTQLVDPCQSGPKGSNVQTSLVSASTDTALIAACGYNISTGAEDKLVHVSFNAGATWTLTKAQPADAGYLQTLAAGTQTDAILGTSRGGAQVTYDGGATWTSDQPSGIDLSFVGFISDHHIVALADRSDETQGAFASSRDAGRHWVVTRFPK
jgi:photosystem II stability/assembly factor-like uncharacterized protein